MVVYAGLAGGQAYVAASRDAWGWCWRSLVSVWSLVSLGDQRRMGLAVGAGRRRSVGWGDCWLTSESRC